MNNKKEDNMNKRESKGEVLRRFKYHFTEEEIRTMSIEMAEVIKAREKTEDDKKTVASQFTAKINELTAQSVLLSHLCTDKYEYREGKCELILDHDSKRREYVLLATGEVVATEPFTDADYQGGLFREESE